MAKKKTVEVGIVKFSPRDLTKNQGHEYGVGRKDEAHSDKRSKRSRTRQAKATDALKGW